MISSEGSDLERSLPQLLLMTASGLEQRLASTLIVVGMFLEKQYYAKNHAVTTNLANTGVQSTQKLKKIQLKSFYIH